MWHLVNEFFKRSVTWSSCVLSKQVLCPYSKIIRARSFFVENISLFWWHFHHHDIFYWWLVTAEREARLVEDKRQTLRELFWRCKERRNERGLAVDEFEAENVITSDFGCLTNPCAGDISEWRDILAVRTLVGEQKAMDRLPVNVSFLGVFSPNPSCFLLSPRAKSEWRFR